MKTLPIPKWKNAASLICLASLTLVSSVSATVLFTDNFNIGTGGNANNNLNLNYNLGVRQAGPLAPATYTGITDHHQVGNTATDVGQTGGAAAYGGGYVLNALGGKWQSDLNIAALSAGPLTIEFDLFIVTNSSTDWAAFSLRAPGDTFPVAGANEFGFLRRHNGGIQVFQNGNSGPTPSGWDTANFALDPHVKLIFTDTAGTGSAFNGNGSKVTFINGTTTLGTVTLGQQLMRSGLKAGFNGASGGNAALNGFFGIDNITISGTQPAVAVKTVNQSGGSPFTPSWTAETPNLIAGMSPSFSAGNFGLESSGGISKLTDGTIGTSGTIGGFATCGANAGNTLIYALTNSLNGSDVTNIVVYSGWGDAGRHGQYYDLSYSTVSAPTTWIPITTVFYLPGSSSGASANQVTITGTNGTLLASAAGNIKLDFGSPPNAGSFNNGYQGYSEIIVQGTNTATPPLPPSPILVQDTLPSYAATVVGDQVIFTAAYSNAPPASLQWIFVSGGVTNVLAGQNSATLTLNNVQTSNSGNYLLKAVNATNGAATPAYTSGGTLVVNPTPTAVNNIIFSTTEQLGLGAIGPVNTDTNFYPTWTVNTANDLISGFLTNDTAGVQGTAYPGTGNFDMNIPVYGVGPGPLSADPSILTDNSGGYITYWPSVGGNITQSSCGAGGAGDSITYTLPSSTYGFDVTNITVYGGWGDAGRNEQKYQVLYSTVANPTIFTSLGTFDYNPTDPSALPTATRTMLIPVSGALAKNVYAVTINWNVSPAPKNNWEGYSEVVVQGVQSLNNPILVQDTLPGTAATVVGDTISFTATYSNSPAANLQWQFVSTNSVVTDISGATTDTLTLNNLQLTNSGSYRLKAVSMADSSAISYSTAAPLAVTSVSAPVNNIIVSGASQTGLGPISGVNVSTNFYPTWMENTNGNLILGSTDGGPSVPGTVFAGGGNFAPLNSGCYGDPAILSDGSLGYQNYYPGIGGNSTLDACGNNAGFSVTYTLPDSSSTGWSLTNITVYGGWSNNQRDELKYEVLYSTISAPTVFNSLITVDYNPAGLPAVGQSATRSTLVPATGAMAQNVYAIEINFFNAASGSENGWSGYSEIVVAGQASPPVPVLTTNVTPNTAEDVVGGSLTLTANFSGATSYQWVKNGTNLVGATNPTLVLNNLQLSDMATNNGYRLVAFNSTGSNVTSSCKVFVDPAPVAVSNIITAVAYQTSPTAGFTPTWDTSLLGSSLIAGQSTPLLGYDPTGNFADPDNGVQAHNLAGGLLALTDGGYGAFDNTGAHPAFATCGPGGPSPGAGQYVIYQLGNGVSNPNGYDVTSIQIAGGWNDNGRNSQYYTVSYSTVANPTMFFPLVTEVNDLSSGNVIGGGNGKAVPAGSGTPTTVRTTFTPATGVLASNVYAIYVDYTVPNSVPNGYSGYSEIAVFGSTSATLPSGPVITTSHEETNQLWTVETNNLVLNQLPSSFGAGSFANEGCAEVNLTDGVIGFGSQYGASCGADGTAVPSIVFTPTNGTWNITNIIVYSLWHDYGRDGQFYTVSYSTLTAPTTFLPIASVAYNPFVPHDGRATGNRVEISPAVGQVQLATNVAAVKFDFTSQGIQDFGWTGYSEIVLQGTNLASTVVVPPTITSTRAAGGNLILTGSGGTPGAAYTWLSTTNLSAPIVWATNSIGNLDGAGAFSNSIPMGANPATFFRLRLP